MLKTQSIDWEFGWSRHDGDVLAARLMEEAGGVEIRQ